MIWHLCRLTIPEVVNIALDVARAVNWIHLKQVVHQDLHAGNVLCALDGSGYRLSDFGNADRMFQADGTRTRSYCPM